MNGIRKEVMELFSFMLKLRLEKINPTTEITVQFEVEHNCVMYTTSTSELF